MHLVPASLTTRTILFIGAVISLVIITSVAITYGIMHREIEARVGTELQQQALFRSSRESDGFLLARDIQEKIRRLAVERYPDYLSEENLRRFDELYMRYPDGAVRSRPGTSTPNNPVAGWIHRDTPLNDELKQRVVLFTDLAEQFKGVVGVRFADIFFTTPEQVNLGTDPPGLPQWAMKVEADFAQNEEEWVASVSRERDPGRVPVWQGIILDPVWKNLLMGLATPIDLGERHLGTVHFDMILDELVARLARENVPGTLFCIFQEDGLLIAHSKRMDEWLEYVGRYRIQESGDAELQAIWHATQGGSVSPLTGYDETADRYYAIARIEGPNWYLAALLPGRIVRADSFAAAQWVLWSGLASLLLVLLLLSLILRMRIARPLVALTLAAEKVATGAERTTLPSAGDDELSRLAAAFNEMSHRVAERDRSLRQEKRELQTALESLRNTEERWRMLTEGASDFIVVLDRQFAVQYISNSVENVLGYRPEALLHRARFDLVHPQEREQLQRQLAEAAGLPADGRIPILCFRARHLDGGYRHLEGLASNLLGNPLIEGVVVNVRDVTDRVLADEKVRQEQEARYQAEKLVSMGSLLAGVAHELNNPLFVVVGRSMMLEEAVEDPLIKASARKIRTAAERCARIVRTFLAMARHKSRQHVPVKVDEVVQAAAEVLDYTFANLGIEVHTQVNGPIPETLADGDQLHQVFMNLLLNAQQSLTGIKGKRRIEIMTRYLQATDEIEVRVFDNGPGVPDEARTRIFDPYFTTKPMGVGSGIGLSVCLGILESHGGRIVHESPAHGGCLFITFLPVVDVSGSESRMHSTEPQPRHCRVLVIDDEEEVRETLRDILTIANQEVSVCSSGEAGLELLAMERFDLVICDLNMPNMNGVELFHCIENRWPELSRHLIFMTGDTLSQEYQGFIAECGRPVIEKPFFPSDLCELISQA